MIHLLRLSYLLVICVTFVVNSVAADRLKVLFIISDDLNTALSGMEHPEFNTPNLDKFAKSGVAFTRTFCQFPLCGSSLASIMSGQYPLVNGVTSNGGDVDPHRFSKIARAQYASIEVEENNDQLLADRMAADKAIEFLQTRADKAEPFFLAVGMVRPHPDASAPPEWRLHNSRNHG